MRRRWRACMGINRETTRRTFPLLSYGGLAHSLGTLRPADVSSQIPSRVPSPPSRGLVGLLVRGPRTRSRPRWRERTRATEGGKERSSGRASEASKEERASEETRTSVGGGKEDYYYSWGLPTTRPAAATPVRSQSALDRRPLDFAIHERR